jgi:hypothetical protein
LLLEHLRLGEISEEEFVVRDAGPEEEGPFRAASYLV